MHRRNPTPRPIPLALLTILAAAPAVTAQAGGVDTVGRAVAKRYARLGRLPDPATIVVADLVNYHRHRIPLPKAGADVALDLRWDAPLPVEFGESVLQIGLATRQVDDTSRLPPLELAVVVDRSGSMRDDRKLACVKASLHKLVAQLRPTDKLAIVSYAETATVDLNLRSIGDGHAARRAIDTLQAGGATNLHGGMMCGYHQLQGADDRPIQGETDDVMRRVVLLTDGIANRGETDPTKIAADSKACNDTGIDLSTIGVGQDFNHTLLDELADTGRGSFHFVADRADIEKVFVEEVQSIMGVVARDVTLTIDGDGFELVHVYGHTTGAEDGPRARLELDNFNVGMTRVVLLKLRPGSAGRSDTVRIRLTYHDADGKPRTVSASTPVRRPSRDLVDDGVRKNFTIAVMARGLRRMAECAHAKRYGEADGYLRRALEYAREQYPSTRDEDITSIRGMLEKYQGVLGKHIEVYRDL